MIKNENAHSATTDGLTISPSLDLVSQAEHVPPEASVVDRRTVKVCLVAIVLGVLAAFVAKLLILLIDFITNFSFFHRISLDPVSPGNNTLGIWAIGVPVAGGLIVG